MTTTQLYTKRCAMRHHRKNFRCLPLLPGTFWAGWQFDIRHATEPEWLLVQFERTTGNRRAAIELPLEAVTIPVH